MKKKFDAVEFQRKAREELNKKYTSDRETFIRQLQEKYGGLKKKSQQDKVSMSKG